MADYWAVLGYACAHGDSFTGHLSTHCKIKRDFYDFLVRTHKFRLNRWELESLRYCALKLDKGYWDEFQGISNTWGSAPKGQPIWSDTKWDHREFLEYIGLLCIDQKYASDSFKAATNSDPNKLIEQVRNGPAGNFQVPQGMINTQLRPILSRPSNLTHFVNISNNGWVIPAAKPCGGGAIFQEEYKHCDPDVVALNEALEAVKTDAELSLMGYDLSPFLRIPQVEQDFLYQSGRNPYDDPEVRSYLTALAPPL
ncbi:MAG: hypothetical protein AAF604_19250 [Acidobacteriota bacterium]